mgnify:CR=1 FL=1
MQTIGDKSAQVGTINDRVMQIINNLFNGSQAEFAKQVGVSTSLVNNIVGKRKSAPSFDVLQKIFTYVDVRADWLLTGEGPMLRETIHTDTGMQVSETPAFAGTNERRVESQDIPLYSFSVTGGLLENIDNSAQYIEDTLHIPNAPKCDGAVRVVGSSMTPVIRAGDIIAFALVHDIGHILYGQIYFVDYVIEFDTFMVCKVMRKSERGDDYVSLHSLNPDYDPVDIPRAAIRHLALVKLSICYMAMA